jgi:hypothetical protein
LAIFEGISSPLEVVVLKEESLFKEFSMTYKAPLVRQVAPLVIDQCHPWDFFDGACQGDAHVCGLGFVVFVSEIIYYSFKANGGMGTNNRVEFLSLFYLLKFSSSKNIHLLQ